MLLSDQTCLGKLKPEKEQAEAITIHPVFNEVLDVRLGVLLSLPLFCVSSLPCTISPFPISPSV